MESAEIRSAGGFRRVFTVQFVETGSVGMVCDSWRCSLIYSQNQFVISILASSLIRILTWTQHIQINLLRFLKITGDHPAVLIHHHRFFPYSFLIYFYPMPRNQSYEFTKPWEVHMAGSWLNLSLDWLKIMTVVKNCNWYVSAGKIFRNLESHFIAEQWFVVINRDAGSGIGDSLGELGKSDIVI